ncbi:acyl-CoA dehydrogenase family protein [Pimelobacter simplex]|uniref:acyl-CoA dehydrogenase family protein n=1 Tax=Nocardioides simplex TaxID=2045 RepID=UPI0038025944
MGNDVLSAIEERAEQIAATGAANEKLGRLDDQAVALLRETGVMRMLQPAKYGGRQSTPAEFAEAVMKVAACDGATGWVAGIVGLHPWEMAMMDSRLQEEVWGSDPDVWIASPYAPMGMLTPADGGFHLSGRWQFSSGTDHCDWIFLGATKADADGNPDFAAGMWHVVLPRADYTIVEDSWDVVGLRGTGSKDVVVDGAFIPDYRVLAYERLTDGSAPRDAGLDDPTYLMPFTTVFPSGITSAVLGICEGALAHHLAYQTNRLQISGTAVREDPYVLSAIGAAAAEIHASKIALLDSLRWSHDRAAAGHELTFAERSKNRQTQVTASWRAVRAMDEIVARSGGNGLRMDHPLQRFWRDGHMGLAHAINVPGPVLHASALGEMDIVPPPGPLHSMI